MTELFSDGLLGPALVLAVIAWLVPKLWARVLPEGVWPLMLIGLLSTLTMFVLTGAFFAALYVWQGAPWSEIAELGLSANLLFFGRLGLSSALLWAPIMVLSLAGLPRHWTKAVW